MYTLAFDTTGAGCGIALADEDKILSEFEKEAEFGQAEILMPQIQKMLQEQSLSFQDLGALFVCVGPGSFTGVRSSIAAARVFGFAAPELKLSGVTAFEAYLATLSEEGIADKNAVIIETRRDDFYVQIFDRKLQNLTEPMAVSYEEALKFLKKDGCLVSLVGDGVERFLDRPSGLTLHAIKMYDVLPIRALMKAGQALLKEKKLNYPKPLYLRAPDVTIPAK